jgi:hypothetical protein
MTVRRHIKSGSLRSQRAGRRIRVPEEEVDRFMERSEAPAELSPEDLRTWLFRELATGERDQQRRWADGIKALQRPIDVDTATLLRVSRREDEVLYGDKTWEELIAEES